jgi:glycosyltransferase involved in cell wall biosynthesis
VSRVVPDVTVVIPTRDRPHVVGRAIASALRQPGVAVEVIVVDDGSAPDAARATAEMYGTDRRVHHLRNETSIGNPASRDRGLEEVGGRYFCTLDDDDEFLPGRLAAQVETLERVGGDDVVAVMGVEIVWSDGRPPIREQPTVPGPVRLDTSPNRFGLISPRAFLNSYLVPVGLMRKVGGYDPVLRWGEHTDLFLRLQDEARFVALPMIGTRVRRDTAQALDPGAWGRKAIGVSRILEKHAAVFEAAPRLRAVWLDGLGMAYLRTGRRGEAVRSFRLAARADPGRLRTWRHLVAAVSHTEAVLCRGIEERVPD